MNECKLQAVLKSIKGYFFMEFGDLFVHFMESFEADLLLPKKAKSFEERTFSQAKMQNLFELLVRTSSANSDPYKEDISCRIDNSTLY